MAKNCPESIIRITGEKQLKQTTVHQHTLAQTQKHQTITEKSTHKIVTFYKKWGISCQTLNFIP
jgi:GH18 family chitinase